MRESNELDWRDTASAQSGDGVGPNLDTTEWPNVDVWPMTICWTSFSLCSYKMLLQWALTFLKVLGTTRIALKSCVLAVTYFGLISPSEIFEKAACRSSIVQSWSGSKIHVVRQLGFRLWLWLLSLFSLPFLLCYMWACEHNGTMSAKFEQMV